MIVVKTVLMIVAMIVLLIVVKILLSLSATHCYDWAIPHVLEPHYSPLTIVGDVLRCEIL